MLPGRELDLGESLAEIFERLGPAAGRGTARRAAPPAARPGRWAPWSIRSRLRQRRSDSTGSSEPIAKRAPRTPIVEISAGAISAPSANDPTITLSRQPKIRAATSGGAARCRSVIAEMSTIVLPTPTIAERQRRDHGGRGGADEQERHAPEEQPDREVGGDPRARRRARATTAAPSSAPTRRRPAAADAGRAEAEQLQRDRDDEDAERSRNDTLGAVEPDQQAQPRLGAIARKPA